MATSHKTTKQVNTYTLVLSEHEAVVLQCILRNVGGHPDKSPRGFAQSVEKAMLKLDIPIITFAKSEHERGIYFKDDSYGRDAQGNMLD